MSTPYICPECQEPYRVNADYAICPHGHGGLRPLADGLSEKQAAARVRAAARAAAPVATPVHELVFRSAIYLIDGHIGLYEWSAKRTEIIARRSTGGTGYFLRATWLESQLEKLGYVPKTERD